MLTFKTAVRAAAVLLVVVVRDGHCFDLSDWLPFNLTNVLTNLADQRVDTEKEPIL
jgi:hypothetical protein